MVSNKRFLPPTCSQQATSMDVHEQDTLQLYGVSVIATWCVRSVNLGQDNYVEPLSGTLVRGSLRSLLAS